MLNFLKDSMDVKVNRCVNLHVFHLCERQIDQRNRNERIRDEFYFGLDRYEHLK